MRHDRSRGVINYFVNYTSVFSLTPWRNSMRLFHEEGYIIRVYQYDDERIRKYPGELEAKYELVPITYPKCLKYGMFIVKTFFRALRHLGLTEISTIGDGVDCLVRNYYFVLACIMRNRSEGGEIFIAGDPGALVAAHSLAGKRGGTLVYWSLELYIERNMSNFGLRLLKKAERRCNRDAVCTIDFGEIRCRVLREENAIEPGRMISIPNSQIGPGKIARNVFFNEKFGIPHDKIIVLHAGGLFGHWLHVKDIFESLAEWPEDWVLVLHTHQRPYPGCGFAIPEQYINKKVFLNDDPVAFDELDVIYSSCDIGIMLHGPCGVSFDPTLWFSDLSVGKIFHHLKVGVPLVVRDLPGYRELFEGRGAGVCVSEPNDILPAIRKILANHLNYRRSALDLHESYRFEVYHEGLARRLDGLRNATNLGGRY